MDHLNNTPGSLNPYRYISDSRGVVIPNRSYSPSGSSQSDGSSDNRKSKMVAPHDSKSSAAFSTRLYTQHPPHPVSSGTSDMSAEYDSDHSSAHLTPPQGVHEPEKPPYKPRRGSSESLTMWPFVRKVNTSPGHVEGSLQNRRRQKRDLEETMHKADQWLPRTSSPPNPTYSEGVTRKHVNCIACQHTIEQKEKQRQSEKAEKRSGDRHGLAHGMRSSLAKAVTTTGSISTTGRLNTSSWASEEISLDDRDLEREESSPNTVTKAASKMIKAVLRKLTLFEVPAHHLETPATITLRRASETLNGPSINSFIKNNGSTAVHFNFPETRSPAEMEKLGTGKPLSAYLISSQDVDSIAEIIKQTFLEHGHIGSTVPALTELAFQSLAISSSLPPMVIPAPLHGRMILSKDGLNPRASLSAYNATTITDINGAIPALDPIEGARNPSLSRLQGKALSWIHTKASVHEVIWEDNGPESKRSSSEFNLNSDRPSLALSSSSVVPCPKTDTFPSESVAAAEQTQYVSRQGPSKRPTMKKTLPSLIPLNNPTIELAKAPNNWPGELPDMTPASWEVTSAIDPVSPMAKAVENPFESDVVSFPPLVERKRTSDWISPLPDITLSQDADVSLYALGVDAHTGIGSPSVEFPSVDYFTPSPATSFYEIDSNIRTRSRSVVNKSTPKGLDIHHLSVDYQTLSPMNQTGDSKELGARVDTGIDSIMGQNGSELGHQSLKNRLSSNAVSRRTGDSFSLGSSIGISTGKRRESSVHVKVKSRAATVLREGDPWQKYRKDSGWPAKVKDIFGATSSNPSSSISSASQASSSSTSASVSGTNSVQGDRSPPEAGPSASRYELAIKRDNHEWEGRQNKKRSISRVDSQLSLDARSKSEEKRSLLQEKPAKFPVMDDSGIYDKLTGTMLRRGEDDMCLLEYRGENRL